jgi:hypothetical protein
MEWSFQKMPIRLASREFNIPLGPLFSASRKFPFFIIINQTSKTKKEETVMATKKSINIWILLGILIIAAWLLGSATKAGAESKPMNYRVSGYLVHNEVLPVGDVEGHTLSIYSRKGLAFFETGEVATFTNWVTSDAIKSKSISQGYSMVTFEDGSTIVEKLQTTAEPGPKGLSLFKGTGEYIKGTGRFEGIKGSYTYSGKALTPYSKETKGDIYYDVVGTYTLPR